MGEESTYQSSIKRQNDTASSHKRAYTTDDSSAIKPPTYQLNSSQNSSQLEPEQSQVDAKQENYLSSTSGPPPVNPFSNAPLAGNQSVPYDFGKNADSTLVEVQNDEKTSTQSQEWTPPALAGQIKMPDMAIDQIGKELVGQLTLFANSNYSNDNSCDENENENDFTISSNTEDPQTIEDNIQQLGMIMQEKQREIQAQLDQEKWRKEDEDQARENEESLRRSRLSPDERQKENEEKRVAEINSKIDDRLAKGKRLNAERQSDSSTENEGHGESSRLTKPICLHGNFCPELEPIKTEKKDSALKWWAVNQVLSKIATIGPFKLEAGPGRLDCDDFVLYDTKKGWFPQKDKCIASVDSIKAIGKEMLTSKIKGLDVIDKSTPLSGK